MAQEKNFEDKVKAYLKNQGCYFIKYWGGAAYTKAGVPDLLVCAWGQFIGIELKAPKGEPSLLQLKHLERIQKAGGWGILLYPGEFEQFKIWLDDRLEKRNWYLKNLELQEFWKNKLERRLEKDGNKEEGNT